MPLSIRGTRPAIAQRYLMRSGLRRPPIVVGRGHRLEMDGNDLRGGDQAVRILRVHRAQFLQDLGIRLRRPDALSRERDRELFSLILDPSSFNSLLSFDLRRQLNTMPPSTRIDWPVM